MIDDVLSKLIATAVAEAQAPLVAKLEEVRRDLEVVRDALEELKLAAAQHSLPEQIAYLRISEVARRVDASPKTIDRWIQSGVLPCVRLPGGGKRVAVAEVERMLHRPTENPHEEAAE